MKNKFLPVLSLSFLSAFAVGCNDTGFSVSPATISPVDPSAVCSPFGGSGTGDALKGLKGSLHYYDGSDPRISSITNTASFNSGTAGVNILPNPIYLSQLDIPTRSFTDGFLQSDGQLLKTLSGEVLIEWFSLRMESRLVAATAAEAGDYQLAVNSDDGSVLRVDTAGNGNFETLVDNDGIHAPFLKCSDRTVRIQAGTPLPMKIDYFQGPRHHISIQLLWRKFDSARTGLACDSSQLSVVPSRALLLPAGSVNPCVK